MRSEMEELSIALDFETFPVKHTCEGEDVSPSVSVSGLKSPYLALILDDPDAPGGTFTHWVIWNIKASGDIPGNIAPGERPDELPGAVQGVNSGGGLGYMGPCPPRGSVHRYYLKVYGLDAPLDLPPGASKKVLEAALRGHVRQHGEVMATFGRR
jgi:Raf kinase inhibitor-like YbhB/YbcL family protein